MIIMYHPMSRMPFHSYMCIIMHEPTGRSGLALYGVDQGYSVQDVYFELKSDYKPRR